MNSIVLTLAGISIFMMAGCNLKKAATEDMVTENISNAVSQYSLMTNRIEASDNESEDFGRKATSGLCFL